MRVFNKAAGLILIAFTLLLTIACSKDDSNDEIEWSNDSFISMKINGVEWKSDLGSVMTIRDVDDEEYDNFFAVSLTGVKGEVNENPSSDSESESINIAIYLPESKFKNPKGTYVAGDYDIESPKGASIITFGKDQEGSLGDFGLFYSIDPNNPEKIMGEVKVNDFKIGNQTLLGEGYTHLSGTFKGELYQINQNENESPVKLTITEGKFNLRPTSLFGM